MARTRTKQEIWEYFAVAPFVDDSSMLKNRHYRNDDESAKETKLENNNLISESEAAAMYIKYNKPAK